MSKLNKANNTSIFFDEILASFRPFILLVLMIVPIKSLIYYRPKYLSYGGIFFTLYACLYSNNVKMRSLRYKISNNPKLNDVLSCSFKYIVFSQRKNAGAKSFTLAI